MGTDVLYRGHFPDQPPDGDYISPKEALAILQYNLESERTHVKLFNGVELIATFYFSRHPNMPGFVARLPHPKKEGVMAIWPLDFSGEAWHYPYQDPLASHHLE